MDEAAHPPSLPSCSKPLGTPLPADEHACSVSLPTWGSVVGYEEGDAAITKALKCGYPRFVYHPYVLQLMHVALQQHGMPDEDCLVLPNLPAAVRCQNFLQQALEGTTGIDNALLDSDDASTGLFSNIRIQPLNAANVHAVMFPATTTAGMEAKAYWQHTGEVVSSRRAEQALQSLDIPVQRVTSTTTAWHPSHCDADSLADPLMQLQSRIGEYARIPTDHVFLTPSGMSAMYTALRSSRRRLLRNNNRGGRSIVYGFPYLDTLKLCSRAEFCPDGVEFFGHGDVSDLRNLELLLGQGSQYCALFTEVPSNPLLLCPDLFKLRELSDRYNFCLIVDDTISNFLNIDILQTGLADAVCSSLTKLVSGRGDVMAGSVVTNPHTEKGRWMQHDLVTTHDCALLDADAMAVLRNAVDFRARNDQINDTAERLYDWLSAHTDVQRVYYPKAAPLYKQVQSGGYGGLMSIVLDQHMCQRTFYDALDVAKGPSLGTNFTLVCPYTLLAHYHELDFAMSCNVPPNLLRIAVGLEPFETLQDKFEAALRRSKLHPKMGKDSIQKRAYSTAVSFGTLHNPGSTRTRRTLQVALRRLSTFVR